MSKYEQILSKISPVFYKFINYSFYFNKNLTSVISYLDEIDLYPNSQYFATEVPIMKIPTYFLVVFRLGMKFSPTISIYEDYRKGKIFHASYDEAIVSLVINNFSFEKHSVPDVRRLTNDTYKDFFIGLVGRDIYDTIRENIK